MATLDKLPADGKLPDQMPANPDLELAMAWTREHGGTMAFYGIVPDATAPADRTKDKLALAGEVQCDAPFTNYANRKYYSIPQVRTLDDKARQAKYQESLMPKETEQPNWNYGQDLAETQYAPAQINRPPSTDPIGQPDFGWTPNPEDCALILPGERKEVVIDKVPMEEPDFNWNGGNGDQKPVPETIINRPPSTDPITQPPFGWTPQRKLEIAKALLAAVVIRVDETLDLTTLIFSNVPTDEFEFTGRDDTIAKVNNGILTGIKAGVLTIEASVKGFEDYKEFFDITVSPKAKK
ncbi:hypothetical protein D7B12_17905 [Salmonella enterica]|nr:hypothetical protein [Salmonella enterica]